MLDIARERVCDADVVGFCLTQKCREVTQRSKTQTHHNWVLGDIGEFVERRRRERSLTAKISRRQLYRRQGGIGVIPIARGTGCGVSA